jgi:hypothetical protein
MARKSELDVDDLVNANFDLLTEQHASDLVRLLAQWPDVLLNTAKTLEPITVLSYLFRMTHMLSSSYDVLKVIGSEPEVKKARMALYASARQVLNNGMRILGLSPVERLVSSLPLETPVTKFLQHVISYQLYGWCFLSVSFKLYLLVALGAKSGANKNGIMLLSYRLSFFHLLVAFPENA